MAYTPDFASLLRRGHRFGSGQDETTGTIEPVELGQAVLPTGDVVGCDPLVNPGADPYTVAVAPGSYPVIAWVAVFTDEHDVERDRRVAALEMRIADAPATAWEMAVTGTDSPVAELDADGFHGYPVDTGCGTLADRAALRPLGEWDEARIDEVFVDQMDWDGPAPGRAEFVTDAATGANVLTVGSGWGDGSYPTFIGRDAGGAVVAFVTDFLLAPADGE
jgi:hypothetical protein